MTRLAVFIFLVAGPASAMSSVNYSTELFINDEGGGTRVSANYGMDISIGKDVVGLGTSSNYRNELGLILPVGERITVPSVVATIPLDGAADVSPSEVICITFSEPMKQTETQNAFAISPGTVGSFSWKSDTMSFKPKPNFANKTTYTVTISRAAVDLDNTTIRGPYEFSFTTRPKNRVRRCPCAAASDGGCCAGQCAER